MKVRKHIRQINIGTFPMADLEFYTRVAKATSGGPKQCKRREKRRSIVYYYMKNRLYSILRKTNILLKNVYTHSSCTLTTIWDNNNVN